MADYGGGVTASPRIPPRSRRRIGLVNSVNSLEVEPEPPAERLG